MFAVWIKYEKRNIFEQYEVQSYDIELFQEHQQSIEGYFVVLPSLRRKYTVENI